MTDRRPPSRYVLLKRAERAGRHADAATVRGWREVAESYRRLQRDLEALAMQAER